MQWLRGTLRAPDPTRPRAPGPTRLRAWVAGLAFACVALVVGACTASDQPEVSVEVPDTFTVDFTTSAGDFSVEFVRAWSPLAVERVHELVRTGFWEGARFYRVNERYAQFGYSGDPAADSLWVRAGIPDEPVVESNARGTVSFARGGPGTRSAILFVNRTENDDLDDLDWNGVLGFPPVGRVTSGMSTIDALFSGYGDQPMQWEDSIGALGNSFLDRIYPELDSITGLEVVSGGE